MQARHGALARGAARLAQEPSIHFLFLGALLFLAHRLIVGDPRTIVISPVLRDDLARRFRDQSGHWPNAGELDAALAGWKRDEALYREALRDRLDREDANVRIILADKVRSRAAYEFQRREPSQAELDHWLAQHRDLYETPLRYDCDYVAFARKDPFAKRQRQAYEVALRAGTNPVTLGRPIFGPNLTREQLTEKFGARLSASICGLPLGEWQALDSEDSLLLLRVKRVEGGLPPGKVLHARMVSDWQTEMQRQAVERAIAAIVGRYRFEEQSR